MIPLSVPSIQGNEWKYIKECLDTGWVSSIGRYVDLFEEKIKEYTGVKYAISCVNGTSALHIALQLAGVRPGDEVIVPTLTFIAPVNVVRYLNANPVFMDADEFFNIDVEKTINFIHKCTKYKSGYTINKLTNKRIAAIIPVHVFGNAVDIEPFLDICHDRNIKIVEDATESLGTRYISGNIEGKHAGTIGTLGCLSFNGNKMITTGGGGMILTDDPGLAKKAKYLTTQAKDDGVKYIHNEVGYNSRLTNIQAGMGVAQLEQLSKFLEAKKHVFLIYKEKINLTPGLHVANVPGYADNNHWMIPTQINKNIYGKDRDELMADMLQNDIEVRPIWHLNHLQKPYEHCQSYKIEKAEDLLAKTLSIPSSVNISEDQVNFVIKSLSNA